jgi:hypothetical protein
MIIKTWFKKDYFVILKQKKLLVLSKVIEIVQGPLHAIS